MTWHADIRAALGARAADTDVDVIEELAQHAEAAFAAVRAEGLDADAASVRVRALIASWTSDPARLGRRPRRPAVVEAPAQSSAWIGIGHDVRYGIRLLRRQPGFALIAVLLIALGVGAATTLASLVYAVLLKPLPWPGADRLVRVAETRDGAKRTFPNIFTNATYLAWRDQPATIGAIAAWNDRTVTITGDAAPERLSIVAATASLFDVLRTHPQMGTLYSSANEAVGSDHVIVLSAGLWRRRFGADPAVLGRTLALDGEVYRIVGVAADDFDFPTRGTQAFVPLHVQPVVGDGPNPMRSVSLLRGIAVLAPGASIDQATAEGTARGRSAPDLGMVGTAVFGTEGKPRVTVTPYLEAITGDVRPALLLLFAAVCLLLAASAANVAGMQLARATARRREVAIRAALGAGPGRLARQLLIENLLIACAGGVAGWLLSLALHRALPGLMPADFPRLDELSADWRVLAIALAAALAASLAFGVVPSLVSRRLNLVEALNEDSLAPAGSGLRSRVGRLRVLTMASQVAIAALLLVGAALVGRTFGALLGVDRGYDPHNLLTATLPMPDRTFTPQARTAELDQIVDRLRRTPGVVAAAASSIAPLFPYDQLMGFRLPASRPGGDPVAVQTAMRTVGPGYFAALGMRVVDGRAFTDADTQTSEPVVIVNRAFVRAYLPAGGVGTTLPVTFNQGGPNVSRIVGVVDDVRQRSAEDPVQPELFNDYRQLEDGMSHDLPVIVARTTGDPAALASTLRTIVHDRDPSLVLDSMMTMDERLTKSLARPRLYAVLLAAFAGFALLLAAAGLFGVLLYSVAQRHRELGVRAALGARPRDIVVLVLRQTMLVAGAGAVVGLGAGLLIGREASALLYGVTWRDPVSVVAVAAVLFVVTTLACYGPARRAARVDPLKALRAR